MLTKHDYQSALDVQSVVDLSGVVFKFAEIMHRISDEACAGNKGTEWKNRHPITRMFAETIARLSAGEVRHGTHLCNCGSCGEAHEFCKSAATAHPPTHL